MEGASIGMTSYLSGIPFLVIRSISDVIGKDNLITYDKFLKKSSTEVAEFTLEIINNLQKTIRGDVSNKFYQKITKGTKI